MRTRRSRSVNQIFIDTVRNTGGNNAKRLLIVTGYTTDITKTASADYMLPKDTVAAQTTYLGALLHAVAVRRDDRGCELGEDGAHLGQRQRRRGAEGCST